ncbi:hypothetical protein TYRP_009854, partial [Tyrophagus putrescentiae]
CEVFCTTANRSKAKYRSNRQKHTANSKQTKPGANGARGSNQKETYNQICISAETGTLMAQSLSTQQQQKNMLNRINDGGSVTDRLKLGVKVVVVMVVTNNTELLSHDRVDGVVLEGGRLSLVVVVVILLMTMMMMAI